MRSPKSASDTKQIWGQAGLLDTLSLSQNNNNKKLSDSLLFLVVIAFNVRRIFILASQTCWYHHLPLNFYTPLWSLALYHLSTKMHTLCWLISRIWLPYHYNFFLQSLVFVILNRHTLSWSFGCPLTFVLLSLRYFLQGCFPKCVCRASPSRFCMPGNILLHSHTWVTQGWLWDWGSKAFFCLLLSRVFLHPTIWTGHVRLITVACYSVCSFPLLFKCSFHLSSVSLMFFFFFLWIALGIDLKK